MEEKRFKYLLNEWSNLQKKLKRRIGNYDSTLPSRVERTHKLLDKFDKKIKKNAGGKIDFTNSEQAFRFSKEFDVPYTGVKKFLVAVEKIEEEQPSMTSKERKSFLKNKLEEVRKFLEDNRKEINLFFFNEHMREYMWREGGEARKKMQLITTFYCYEKLEDYLIDRIDELENNKIMEKNSPWGSGSFYLLVFAFIAIGVLLLSYKFNIFTLIIAVTFSILGVGIIGAFQLKNDDKLKDETFLSLVIETYKRLPILGNILSRKKKE